MNLPDELIQKIVMYSIPQYVYLDELKRKRFYRVVCDCEGCEYKQHFGCYYYEFNRPKENNKFDSMKFDINKNSYFVSF